MRPKLGVTGVCPAGSNGHSTVLIKRKGGTYEGYWSLPGGGVRYGEKLADALKREFKEEAGLEIKVGPVPEFLSVTEVIKDGSHKVIVGLGAHLVGGKLKAGSDAAEAGYFTPEQIGRMRITPLTRKLLKLAKQI